MIRGLHAPHERRQRPANFVRTVFVERQWCALPPLHAYLLSRMTGPIQNRPAVRAAVAVFSLVSTRTGLWPR